MGKSNLYLSFTWPSSKGTNRSTKPNLCTRLQYLHISPHLSVTGDLRVGHEGLALMSKKKRTHLWALK